MGLIEVLCGTATAPGTTFTALTMAGDDSLIVRNAPIGTDIRLLQAWALNNAAGQLRLRGPEFHDNVQGIRLDVMAGEPKPLFPMGFYERLKPQQEIIAEITGSAVAGEIETGVLLLYYAEIPGLEGRFISPDDALRRMVHIFPVENTLALGTAGGYSGSEAIATEFDLFEANVDYALLGYLVDTQCALVGWKGVATGQLRVAGPGDELGRDYTADWFVRLSKAYGIDAIPVFNSADKATIFVDGAQDQGGADVTVTSIFARLE